MAFKKANIDQFLLSRHWKLMRSGKLFDCFAPPNDLHLPNHFELEIPIDDTKSGFEKYIKELIPFLSEIYENKISSSDIAALFSTSETILSLRIFDDDTKEGSIQLERFSKAIDNLKLVFKQTVTFLISNKPIFGQAKFQADTFVKQCRALQTETGSFVAKIQMPSETIRDAFTEFDSNAVPEKLFSILSFTNEEIFKSKTPITINREYYSKNIKLINLELLTSIKDLVSQAEINNVSFKFENSSNAYFISLETIKPRIKYFNKYIRDLKDILLEETPLEFTGKVKKLYSTSPIKSNRNEVTIEGDIANIRESVKVILNNSFYNVAIEAHKSENLIKVVGLAKQSKSQYLINNPESFEVVK